MPVREWVDENTGRKIRQLTNFAQGARLDYFRFPHQLPGGLMLAWGQHEHGNVLVVAPDSGEVQPVHLQADFLKLRETDGRMWYLPVPLPGAQRRETREIPGKVYTRQNDREIWAVDLPSGTPHFAGKIPPDIPGTLVDITCDGRVAILNETHQDLTRYPIPTTMDVDAFWHYFARPRHGCIRAYDLQTQSLTNLVDTDGLTCIHWDASPVDPGLLKYCQDMFDGLGQRIWTVRVDGSGCRPIRTQQKHEVVTHEFWWSDGKHIGYTYQDRRQDNTLYNLPWSEYSPAPTQLGIADQDGRERYLSDPLNHYHTHLYRSSDGEWVCGEGTDGHSFVYAAPFSWNETRIDLQPLATIHTAYIPFRGQGVEACFSHDSRWLLYNDTVADQKQICAVQVSV